MRPPRENTKLFGHQKAQTHFLNAFHQGRFPHAWIIGGGFGIGKATFAYQMARYVLSGRHDKNLDFSETDPLCRRIAAQSHGDLLGIEEVNDIGIDVVRGANHFLNQTSLEGGWRVIIIEAAEKLNRNAANALLKRLEEPPPQALFFLITPFPGRLLPTIRSRCQLLSLSPLAEEELKAVLTSQGMTLPSYANLAQGSPGRLMRLMEGKGETLYADLQKVLTGDTYGPFVQAYGSDESSYAIVEDLLRNFLHGQLIEKTEGRSSFFENVPLEQALRVCEKVGGLFDHGTYAQLDKKTTLMCVLSSLEKRIGG